MLTIALLIHDQHDPHPVCVETQTLQQLALGHGKIFAIATQLEEGFGFGPVVTEPVIVDILVLGHPVREIVDHLHAAHGVERMGTVEDFLPMRTTRSGNRNNILNRTRKILCRCFVQRQRRCARAW